MSQEVKNRRPLRGLPGKPPNRGPDGEDIRRPVAAEAECHTDVKPYSGSQVIWCVQINVLLYSTCFWIQQTSFPYFSKKLGVDNITYGYLQTAFAVAQLAGGPLFGRFGDLFGAKAAMTLAYLSGVMSYGMLALSVNIKMLFASRALSIFLAAMQGSQMVVVDVVPYIEQADYLGKLGLWYGIGMVIGPAIGGQITASFSPEVAAAVAATGSLCSMISVLVFIPRYVKKVTKDNQSINNLFDIRILGRLIKYPNAGLLLLTKTIVGVPIGILQSMFSRVAMELFNLAPNYNGMVMSYIGILTMLVQRFGVGYLSQRYPDIQLMRWATLVASLAYAMVSQVSSITQFCVAILPLVAGMTTLQVVISAALTKSVPSSDTGAMIGLGMATNSLIRTVSPTLGAYMFVFWGFPSIGYVGFIVCSAVSAALYRH